MIFEGPREGRWAITADRWQQAAADLKYWTDPSSRSNFKISRGSSMLPEATGVDEASGARHNHIGATLAELRRAGDSVIVVLTSVPILKYARHAKTHATQERKYTSWRSVAWHAACAVWHGTARRHRLACAKLPGLVRHGAAQGCTTSDLRTQQGTLAGRF